MHRAAHYRRFHHLYVDIVAVFAVGVAGWFIWPEEPAGRGDTVLPTPSVAYGAVDPRTVGSLLYPGHFAFSSPIGFGATAPSRTSADPRWSVGAMLPFAPPLARLAPDDFPPAEPAATLPPPPPPPQSAYRTASAAPVAAREFLEVDADPALRSRAFELPAFAIQQMVGTNAPAGEVRAHVQLNRDGWVEHVVFPPGSGVTWVGLRPLESVMIRATATRADAPTSGWVRVRWQTRTAR